MCIAWGVIMLFNLITLPVEFDASNRAKKVLIDMGFIRGQAEITAVNQVLNAAALTYVAAFLTSLGYLLFYLLPLVIGEPSRLSGVRLRPNRGLPCGLADDVSFAPRTKTRGDRIRLLDDRRRLRIGVEKQSPIRNFHSSLLARIASGS